ncbi:FecR family protein [Flagellimonas marina]|uniref:FecR family protein n=1 Tax=Flagellimonas marina TaxID=1775168 RepID=A0ABV8PGK9_9FLAO
MKYLNKKQAKSLFKKYLKGQCTPEEEELLESFLQSYQDDSNIWSDLDFNEAIKERVWEKLKNQAVPERKSTVRKIYSGSWIKYAAVVIGLTVALISYFNYNDIDGELLKIDEEMIVLQTGDGKNNLNENAAGEITNESGKVIASQRKGVLSYKKDSTLKELVYNEIKVPRGKTFKLILSDGTWVHLNAGTSLRFPVNFLPDANREVFLLGEAYFEVARDEQSPFIVQANDMEVEVLGTHFNVSSYEGSNHHTVLVEGSVQVNNKIAKTLNFEPLVIKPGQKASLVPEGLNINEVDVKDYIGWTQDLLIFNDDSFTEIIQKIERRYNVEVENNYSELNDSRFHGKFSEESIIDLMNTFKESANFDYLINDGKIIINKKENAYGDMNKN